MKSLIAIGIFVGLSLTSVANATTCLTNTWTFGAADCQIGTNNNGVSFTQGGETITIFPQQYQDGTQIAYNSGTLPVNGLFETNKGTGGNLASGIGPYNPNQGGDPYTSQLGIQDTTISSHLYNDLLIIEISQNAPGTGGVAAGGTAAGTTLNFLMQQGDQTPPDTFNVYTSIGSSTLPTTLASMNEVHANLAVGPANGGATVPQFSVKTTTTGTNPYEFIAIQSDCQYLLLNSITIPVTGTPEPRFYGMLLAGLLGIAGTIYRKRQTT
jgi:hypothetical protein